MKVGSKVICVDSFIQEHTREQIAKDCPNFVVKGKHYTIRAIRDFDFVESVLLEEVENPILYFKAVNANVAPGFKKSRFRLLKEDEVSAEKIEQENLIEI
jgi:hypothetical protein